MYQLFIIRSTSISEIKYLNDSRRMFSRECISKNAGDVGITETFGCVLSRKQANGT